MTQQDRLRALVEKMEDELKVGGIVAVWKAWHPLKSALLTDEAQEPSTEGLVRFLRMFKDGTELVPRKEGDDTPFRGVAVSELLAALASRAETAPQWQPIETAPKDGTVCVFWNERQHVAFTGFWGRIQYTLTYTWLSGNEIAQPTHWMPLPKEPHD